MKPTVHSRRAFLRRMARTGAAGAPPLLMSRELFAHSQSPVLQSRPEGSRHDPSRPVGRKLLLGPDDFEYVGAFRLPRDVHGHDGAWGRGLAIRQVNDQLRVLSAAVDGTVFEMLAPAPGTDGHYPEASILTVWGDVSRKKKVGTLNGLYWDEPDQRLYWSSGDLYNAVRPDDPAVGFSTLNDVTGAVQDVQGPWRFSGRGVKATMGGVLSIPQWFAGQYCDGRRLGAGFGGYWSIVATGPAHMGPALCAFAPPDPGTNRARSSVDFTTLVGYPFNAKPYTTPDRCHRDTDYHTEFDGWNPKDGVGYWSWTDMIWQGAVWIDRPTRHGVLFMPTLGRGRTWYANATLNAEHCVHAWYVYDPAQLADVARGKKKQWQVQPARTWDVQFENITYPMPGWRDEPGRMITGAAFDPSSGTLYTAVRFAFGAGQAAQHLVYAFRVA
jgi:hypothetical protein